MTATELIERMRARDDGELEDILATACRDHRVTLEELFSSDRRFAAARRDAWAALHGTGHWSKSRIGDLFGMKHSTVIWGLIRRQKKLDAA